MRYLHVSISSVRMMDTYTRMIRNHFPEEEHRFLYCDKLSGADRALLDYGNSVEVQGSVLQRFQAICREFDAADYIIWHGLLAGAKRMLIPLLFRKYMRKSVWIIRGIDLYNWRKEGGGLKTALTNTVNYHGRKNMPRVCVIFEPDEEVYRHQFGQSAKAFYAPYPISENAFAMMEKYRNCAPRASGKVYIQVAHNAYAFNNHLELLDTLSRYQDENIRVVLPLSYGNDWYNQVTDYKKKVEKTAKGYFGSKAICLKRLMPADEYSDVLCNIDVSVYGAHRQNALGNIFRSLYAGNKVFLPKDNPVYTYFAENGLEIDCTDDIEGMSFQEFIAPHTSHKAALWIREHYHPSAAAVYWHDMFEALRCEAEGRTWAVTDDDRQRRIRQALAEDFTECEPDSGAARRRTNYIDFSRYVELPKGTVFSGIRNVVIAGAGRVGQTVCRQLFQSNKNGMKWDVKGFLDDERECLTKDINDCDIIGRTADICRMENVRIINALETAEQRLQLLDQLPEERRETLDTYAASESVVDETAQVGGGCAVLEHSYIHAGSTVGRCCLLRSATVESESVVGDGCVLLHNSWIGEGAVLGAGVTVGAFARIAPGVVIGDGCAIEPFAIVTADRISERIYAI